VAGGETDGVRGGAVPHAGDGDAADMGDEVEVAPGVILFVYGAEGRPDLVTGLAELRRDAHVDGLQAYVRLQGG